MSLQLGPKSGQRRRTMEQIYHRDLEVRDRATTTSQTRGREGTNNEPEDKWRTHIGRKARGNDRVSVAT